MKMNSKRMMCSCNNNNNTKNKSKKKTKKYEERKDHTNVIQWELYFLIFIIIIIINYKEVNGGGESVVGMGGEAGPPFRVPCLKSAWVRGGSASPPRRRLPTASRRNADGDGAAAAAAPARISPLFAL